MGCEESLRRRTCEPTECGDANRGGLAEDGVADAGFEELGKYSGRDGAAEIVALGFVALVGLEEGEFFRGFDTFGDDAEIQAAAHADDRGYDGGFVGSGGDLANEGLIDFEGVDRKSPEIAEGGESGAKIVDRELDAVGAQSLQDGCGGFSALHQNTFG